MRDVVFTILGLVIFAALRIVDAAQTALRLQPRKRPLGQAERDALRSIFGDSIDLDAVRVVEGNAGLLGISGRAFAIGRIIYLPACSAEILVHECAHVWQFQTGGFGYIGNSALHQLVGLLSMKRYRPYHWRAAIDAGVAWDDLASAEAQAQFVQDLYRDGEGQGAAPGAFFRTDANRFRQGTRDYTDAANAAWRKLRAG